MTTTLDLPFQLGEPQQAPGITLWPLFPQRDPACDYVSLDEAAEVARRGRNLMCQFPEVELVQSQVGRPDDGTDPTGFYNIEFSIPLKPEKQWSRGPLLPQAERSKKEPPKSWKDWLRGTAAFVHGGISFSS